MTTTYRSVYIYLALVIPVSIFAFWKTYFGIIGDLPATTTPSLHVHATLMCLWLIMLVAQAWFIRTKRFRPHRWVGRSSYVIAPLMILSSLITIHGFFNHAPKDETLTQAFRLNELGFGMVLAFAITWGLAIAYRRQAELHIRLIISTAPAIGTAIVWRIFYLWVPGCNTDTAAVIGNGSVLGVLLLVLIVADWRKGVKRSAYWVVTIIQGVAHLGYWTFAKTDGWFAFCQWFTDLPLPGSS